MDSGSEGTFRVRTDGDADAEDAFLVAGGEEEVVFPR